MAIQGIQIFNPDPAKVQDLSRFSAAEVFDSVPLGRVAQLSAEAARNLAPASTEFDEDFSTPSAPSRDGAVASLFGREEVVPSEPQSVIEAALSSGQGDSAADFVFSSEARRDSAGNLAIYRPPSGDGGGAFEIAGITSRYQPEESAALRDLINAGQFEEAENRAKGFFRKRAEPFTRFSENPGLRLQITDSVHHRGEGGLRRILQRATGSSSRDYGTLVRKLEADPNALDKFHAARQAYEWEEVDRGRASRKKFRKGLQNRFNKAHRAAQQFASR